MDFISCGEYATPEEGFRIYLSCFQAQIEEYPFMWSAIPHFFEWSYYQKSQPPDITEL